MTGGPRGTRPPLDLKAVEVRLMQKIRHRSDEVLTIGCDTARDIEALLAHTRALREALRPLTMPDRVAVPADVVADTAEHRMVRLYVTPAELERVATVLAAAQDSPA